MTLIAIDPGLTTGWIAVYKDTPTVRWGENSPSEMWATLSEIGPETIIVEDFVFRPMRTRIDLTPVRVIGRIEEWSEQHEIPIVWQTPSQAKHFFTDARLKEKGLYFKGMKHARDAARHLLYYLEFGEGSGFLRGE